MNEMRLRFDNQMKIFLCTLPLNKKKTFTLTGNSGEFIGGFPSGQQNVPLKRNIQNTMN